MDCTPNSTHRVAWGPQVLTWRQGDASVRQSEANHLLTEGSSLQHFRVPHFLAQHVSGVRPPPLASTAAPDHPAGPASS